ncbi:MAG: putative quorum-quenching lactonase YtnP [Flavobacteriales bacterium]|jgi:glyoxylase-like metal-dependent hydrolase (beta-lactamase superfamily II)|nr:MAG: putative quorum-quenching lactonase YtnP [Flavobacteriales bacterium]|tara:strand:+ start:5104 stop:5967 length:864 start_codon:yes stop_codon:yes gene_type:complete
MTLHAIETGNFKLDGGAMFGVVPKALWSRTNPADNKNRIELAARSLLIEDGNRLILIDTGMGNKQGQKFFSHFDLWGNHSLDKSLQEAGFSRADITDVFLTHLHFDHCGGAVRWNKNQTGYELTFPNATYWSNEAHWEWATQPNAREKASFLSENLLPIQESGQLKFVRVPETTFAAESELGFGVLFVNGHTEKQMIPHISYNGKTLVFAADLLPTIGHLPLPYIMGYDVRPLETLKEKDMFLTNAVNNNFVLFLQHDTNNPLITLQHTDRGVRLLDSLPVESLNSL